MAATVQGFAETQPVADAMRDAATAAAAHAAKVKRTLRSIVSFFAHAAIAITRWVRGGCGLRSRRR